MQLWTHHPSEFRIDQPGLVINPSNGRYSKSCGNGFRYSDVLPMLQERVGANQLLWCCTTRGRYMPTHEPSDCVEWEVNLPLSKVTLISVAVWDDIVWSRGDDWDSLILTGLTESQAASKNINALVRLPLPPGCLTCHGQLPARYLAGGKGRNPAYREFIERIGYNYHEFHQR